MPYEYEKNDWESYDEKYPIEKQPDSIITKNKLDRMELGIERSNMTFETGNIGISNTENPSVSIVVDEVDHTRKLNILFPKQKEFEGAIIDDQDAKEDATWSSAKINQLVTTLINQVNELSYKKIEIETFTSNITLAEKGSTINKIIFNWKMNRVPMELTLNGKDITTALQSITVSDLITEDTMFTLRAIDEKGGTSSKAVTISFVNGIYYGASTLTPNTITSAFIRTLTKQLSSTTRIQFQLTALENQYIYYACPVKYEQPRFFVGGFEGGFYLLTTVDFINEYNHTEKYNIYISTNSNLGYTIIDCK
ncbi:MAG: hypothetical protein PHC62_00270 [Candidatus Izemoplasmatales bacterium]|nr:hypothetical protein [Candidatus Izemoplasmatales bacterium]